jgi:hypothetical protein
MEHPMSLAVPVAVFSRCGLFRRVPTVEADMHT